MAAVGEHDCSSVFFLNPTAAIAVQWVVIFFFSTVSSFENIIMSTIITEQRKAFKNLNSNFCFETELYDQPVIK